MTPDTPLAMSNAAKLSFIRDTYINQHVRKTILPAVRSVSKTDNPLAVISDYFLTKATKTLDAICLLCHGGYAEDAMVLGRSILELCIHMHTIALPNAIDEKRQRAESWIYDAERQRGEKFKELAALKQQGKCLSWLSEFESYNTPFQSPIMPSKFIPLRNLKTMAKEIGGEIECWYHFIYWSVSKLTHPSGIGAHSYFGEFKREEEIFRALIAVTIHFYLTIAVLDVLDFNTLRPPLEKSMEEFVALSNF
jgi:Family of unknown function (DUF5677)